ncbi:hypothetical protein HanXRQr2_Chr17g0797951 [Helianthus annuus]|uniref:Uncharacterized protein n=1 Tax=Helianthus annuus TaxID=4232 RepID=A0A9K3DGN8_HELAN|nr:hypothetical protein HanXRQr2_Chr17g0797951 [Helianthus annuus]KAJ0812772.1 hypothetical protein HanPSC8_Chr17g0765731 [Helianthus annuus]
MKSFYAVFEVCSAERHHHQVSGHLVSRKQTNMQSIKTPLQLLNSSPILIYLILNLLDKAIL